MEYQWYNLPGFLEERMVELNCKLPTHTVSDRNPTLSTFTAVRLYFISIDFEPSITLHGRTQFQNSSINSHTAPNIITSNANKCYQASQLDIWILMALVAPIKSYSILTLLPNSHIWIMNALIRKDHRNIFEVTKETCKYTQN